VSFGPAPGAGGARPSGAAHATLTQPNNVGGDERPLTTPHGRETAHSEASGAVGYRIASSGVAGSWTRAPRSRLATPLSIPALATAAATASATRRLKTLGMM
jgi:hypothetical protein